MEYTIVLVIYTTDRKRWTLQACLDTLFLASNIMELTRSSYCEKQGSLGSFQYRKLEFATTLFCKLSNNAHAQLSY